MCAGGYRRTVVRLERFRVCRSGVARMGLPIGVPRVVPRTATAPEVPAEGLGGRYSSMTTRDQHTSRPARGRARRWRGVPNAAAENRQVRARAQTAPRLRACHLHRASACPAQEPVMLPCGRSAPPPCERPTACAETQSLRPSRLGFATCSRSATPGRSRRPRSGSLAAAPSGRSRHR